MAGITSSTFFGNVNSRVNHASTCRNAHCKNCTSADEKLLEGPRLFDRACRVMADGVRHRHPGLDDKAVLAMVATQQDRLKALEAP